MKRKNCPYFSGIISRSLPHDLLETAEKVGIDLANKLKLAGADAILTKAKVCDRLLFKICFNCQDRLSALGSNCFCRCWCHHQHQHKTVFVLELKSGLCFVTGSYFHSPISLFRGEFYRILSASE